MRVACFLAFLLSCLRSAGDSGFPFRPYSPGLTPPLKTKVYNNSIGCFRFAKKASRINGNVSEIKIILRCRPRRPRGCFCGFVPRVLLLRVLLLRGVLLRGVFRRVCSAGCVPQALLHGHCFCELCFCGFVPRFFRFAGANVGCSRPSGRQPNEDGGVQEAFGRHSGSVRVAFGWRSGASVCRRIRSGAASVFEQPDCRSTFERFLAIHSLRPLCFVIDPDIQKKEPPKRLLKCNLVTDYRTFIEDFQRLVQFVDYLDAREEYLPPIH